jgi:hypothetical protein
MKLLPLVESDGLRSLNAALAIARCTLCCGQWAKRPCRLLRVSSPPD